MKRAYTKPSLVVESFQLDAAIAGSCQDKTTLSHSLELCTLMDEQGPVIGAMEFGGKCDINVLDLDTCYHAASYSQLLLVS